MKTNYYQKPQISVEDQIKLLKSEGLTFINEAKANHLLQNISLFRLKSYLKPLDYKILRISKPILLLKLLTPYTNLMQN